MGLKNPYFEILNSFWTLIKPYAKADDAEVYKKIMSDEYLIFIKDRGKKFTDSWWISTRELFDYPEKYKGTKYCDFAAELAISFCDYWQHEGDEPYKQFMNYVGKAFLNEWGRIREV